MNSGFSRRSFLVGGMVLGAVTLGIAPPARAATVAIPAEQPPVSPTSLNGWAIEGRVNEASTVWTRPVSGTGLEIDVRLGEAEALLVHVVRRIHYEIEEIRSGELVGWQPAKELDPTDVESNLSSGTAVRVRPGARYDAYDSLNESVLRDILADCQGMIRWGGDNKTPDQSLFYVDVQPDDVRLGRIVDRVRLENETPGSGAGSTL